MSNYQKKIEISAKSKDEAIALALEKLGVSEDEVNITVVEEGNKGFLGMGAKDAVVEVEVKDLPMIRAEKFLKDIFAGLNIEVNIKAERNENGIFVDLSGDSMGIVIGKRGETLDSLQYLTTLVANKGLSKDDYTKISLDTENYREKRNAALESLAHKLASKVVRTGRNTTLEPMNAYERRIIHATLQNDEKVTTYSVGQGMNRKVVIALKK